MKSETIDTFQTSTVALEQILQLLPLLDSSDIQSLSTAAKSILVLGQIYDLQPCTTRFEF